MTITARVARALASSRGLFLTFVLAGSLSGLGFLGIDSPPHLVVARFADADGLVAGNEVRIAGVTEGSVNAVQVGLDPSTGKQYATVVFSVDGSHWPLHQGTFVAVKPKGVLSNVFVALTPGSANNPSLGDTPQFALGQTQSPVGLDELSNVFTPSVTESIRTQLQEGVLALGGAGAADLNQTLHYANPLTQSAIPVVDVLATRSPQLDDLNHSFDTISADLAREDSNLRPLITNLDTTLSAIAAKETELQGTLVHAAGVFTTLDQAFGDQTTQADLANIFKKGPQSLTCAQSLSNYLQPLITAVNPYIAYNGQLSLEGLLGEFITATGYNTGTSKNPSTPGIDTLLIDPTLPPNGYSANDTGGLTREHLGYTNATSPTGQPVYQDTGPLALPSQLPDGCAPITGAGQ